MKTNEVVNLREDEMELEIPKLHWKKMYSQEELEYMKRVERLKKKEMALNVMLAINIGILSIAILAVIQAWRCL